MSELTGQVIERCRLHKPSGDPVDEFIFDRAELNALLAAHRREVLAEVKAKCVSAGPYGQIHSKGGLADWLDTQLEAS